MKHERVACWIDIIVIVLMTVRAGMQTILTSSVCSPHNNIYIYYVMDIQSEPKQNKHPFQMFNRIFFVGSAFLTFILLIISKIVSFLSKKTNKIRKNVLIKRSHIYVVPDNTIKDESPENQLNKEELLQDRNRLLNA